MGSFFQVGGTRWGFGVKERVLGGLEEKALVRDRLGENAQVAATAVPPWLQKTAIILIIF